MKSFHDKYSSSSGPHFAIGEIGNGGTTTMAQRLAWLQDITSEATKTAMPNFIACSWFNVSCCLLLQIFGGGIGKWATHEGRGVTTEHRAGVPFKFTS